MDKLSGSIYDLQSLYASGGPNDLLVSIFVPHQQPAYQVLMSSLPTNYSSAQWTANAEAAFDGDFSIRTKYSAPGFENLVMTASEGDVENSTIWCGPWSAHPTQRFQLIQWHQGQHSLVTKSGLAIQPAALGVKGSKLILAKFNDTPAQGQVFISRT